MRGLAAAAMLIASAAVRAETFEAAPGPDGRIVVHVYKKGLFSGFAHDHHFEVTEWRATASVPGNDAAAARVEVVLSARSLRDRQGKLSDADRKKVDGQAAGPEVLDAEHHPTIEFRSERIELEPGSSPDRARGALRGTLTLRGRSGPATVSFEAERAGTGWRARGTSKVKQSSFGIEPFSGFGGTVGVKDELEIEISLALVPRGR
jgi:polyisoprenoid-binding protein YceI